MTELKKLILCRTQEARQKAGHKFQIIRISADDFF